MLRLIIHKLLYGLLVLLGVVILVFFLFQGFGDPARLILGQTGDSATIQNIRKELYLDQPKWKQFALYLNDVSPVGIHTGDDIESKKDVLEVLSDALPGTIILALSAMLIATLFGILLGILAAVKQNTWWDTSA